MELSSDSLLRPLLFSEAARRRFYRLRARKLALYCPFYTMSASMPSESVIAFLAGRSGSVDFLDSRDCQADV